MPVQGPRKLQAQVPRMEILDDGLRVGESEDLMSGVSNITLDDQPRFSSFLKSVMKDGASFESLEMSEADPSTLLIGQSFERPQLEHQNMALSCPQGWKEDSSPQYPL